ncbi:MAG: geranylgeranyl diphosphate synthase type II, partial [Kiritimatiellia bacterium]
MPDFMLWLSGCRSALDAHLKPIFQDAWPAAFVEPMRYPLFSGGKRVRPALCFAAYEAIVGDGVDRSPALAPATAIELVHTYSLVHDDLPALDDDDERRGRPTVHRAYDEPTAILVGDALLTHAFVVLADAPVSAEVRITMVARLARAAGYQGMIGGQVADLG